MELQEWNQYSVETHFFISISLSTTSNTHSLTNINCEQPTFVNFILATTKIIIRHLLCSNIFLLLAMKEEWDLEYTVREESYIVTLRVTVLHPLITYISPVLEEGRRPTKY